MRTTSIQQLLSKIVRDYPLQEEPPLAYVHAWCREALQLIDSYDQWEKKELDITIREYRSPIPTDFYAFDHEFSQQAREQGSDLYFGIRSGNLRIKYLAFPTDEDGFILLPDTPEYLEALSYYCVARMCRKRFIVEDKFINYEAYHQKFLDKKFEARADLYLRDTEARDYLAKEYHNITRSVGITNGFINVGRNGRR